MRELKIVTPDLVTFTLRPAGAATRFMAWLLDQMILLLVRILTILAVVGSGFHGVILIVIVITALELPYYAFFEWRWAGQTPGKRRFGLRVATTNGARLAMTDVLLRNLVRAADNLPAFMLVGGLFAFFDPLGRRLGDFAAGTIVIAERAGTAGLPPVDRARPNSYNADAACRRRILARATHEDRDLANDLMWRRDDLDDEMRIELFRRLAAVFTKRFSLPDAPGLSDEQKVLNVALILDDRNDG
ncbi:MAG: RDD family protein [Planctomycetota bacterium]|jgi:uncharacterized RDD family membrane protein YckC|nr:RDD family protein [Planctomycetota bacterium]